MPQPIYLLGYSEGDWSIRLLSFNWKDFRSKFRNTHDTCKKNFWVKNTSLEKSCLPVERKPRPAPASYQFLHEWQVRIAWTENWCICQRRYLKQEIKTQLKCCISLIFKVNKTELKKKKNNNILQTNCPFLLHMRARSV